MNIDMKTIREHNEAAAEAMYRRKPNAYSYALCAIAEYFSLVYELYEDYNVSSIWSVLEDFGYDLYNVKFRDLKYIVTIGEGYDVELGEARLHYVVIDPFMQEVRNANILDFN